MKVYKLLAITSLMTMDTCYILSDTIDRLKEIKTIFESILFDDEMPDMSPFSEYLDNQKDITYFDDYTYTVEQFEMDSDNNIKVIVNPNTGKAFLFNEVIEYKERF